MAWTCSTHGAVKICPKNICRKTPKKVWRMCGDDIKMDLVEMECVGVDCN